MDAQAVVPALATTHAATGLTSYLDLAPPGSFTLMPGLPSMLPDATFQGAFASRYNDLCALFGLPEADEHGISLQAWTIPFMEDSTGAIVIASISRANSVAPLESPEDACIWNVSGQDRRAVAAVADFIKENYQELCH